MIDLSTLITVLPQEQRAIQPRCVHPSRYFVEFGKEEVEQSIPDRFERVVRKYPDRIAVKTTTHQLTYEELNRAANRLARTIVAKRGEANEPVAIVLGHGVSAVVALLGVLKAGKICVPLDPSYPSTRLQYLLEDSRAALIVSHSRALHLAGDLFERGMEAIYVDSISRLSGKNLALALGPDALATIIYTSGSTGEPKGVVQNHRNLLFDTRRLTNSFGVSPVDRMSHLLACSVLGGVREILSALLNGASLFPFDIKKEGVAGLASWFIGQKVTVCRSVSTVFRSFIASLSGQERFPNLRLIYVGGECVYRRDFELYQKHFSPRSVFVNVYGATETGIVLQYFADTETGIEGVNVPLGFSVEDMEVRLLDDDGREVRTQQIGEITVKSRHIALGYWRNPVLTRTAFLADEKERGKRTYRTGDLGRMLDDGSIEYLGRKDFQAQVRGHRVEVTEVETALLSLDSVKEAVVVAREDLSGGHRLVAYVVPASNCALDVTALHRALSERLPDYMVPSAFVFMDALPLGGIGKVDRSALPAPGRARPQLETEFVASRTPVELVLAGIWSEVLQIDGIGVHDNFFDLGGNSLAATQVISRILKTFELDLPIESLFQAPTVAEIAAVMTQNQAREAGQDDLARILTALELNSDEAAERHLKPGK